MSTPTRNETSLHSDKTSLHNDEALLHSTNKLSSPKIGVIGAGHLGSALLSSILKKYDPSSVFISCPEENLLKPFAKLGCNISKNNIETVKNSDLILLVVRPNIMQTVLDEIKDVALGKCFLSVAAGITIDKIKSTLPAFVMRAMPNTPATVGKGATAITIPLDVPKDLAKVALNIFGECVEVIDESLMAAATSLNGSGPGYFFKIAEIMSTCAINQGIPPKIAKRLTAQTMAGAAEMLKYGNAETLAQNVAVPGGTTAAAFAKFDELGLSKAITEGMLACAKRADELSK